MGISHKGHGKRSDKETQSPMLKIFKDMMQKDKRDPEKTNLLKEKHDRKRKHYSGSKSKSGRQTVSSSSDLPKNEPYKMTQQGTRNAQFEGCASQHTLPFQGEKRESWWFCGETEPKESKAEDTCSCVSCALKKLISTDYACIACITILLVISVTIAILLVYRCIPNTITADRHLDTGKVTSQKPESERLKRKIGSLVKWSFGPKKQWRNVFKRNDDLDFDSFNFRNNDMSGLVESENELSKILDSDKLNDIQHSDRLRDFYKKLVQTDAAIRNLRKTLNDNAYTSTNFDLNTNFDINSNYDINNNIDINSNVDFDSESDRFKRSINFHPEKIFHFKRREPATQSKINNGKLITKSTINMTSNKKPYDKENKTSRNKRFGNFTDEGFIIEKNKVMIQYKPSRVVPKCSHSPNDLKSHETELSHPFYKNTQRLDELLDQFIDKKLPNLLKNRLELGMLFDKSNKKCKHPINEELIVVKDDDLIKDYEQNQRPEDNQRYIYTKDYGNQRENSETDNEKAEAAKALDKGDQSTVKAFMIATGAPKIVSKDIKHSGKVFENDFFDDSDGVEKTNARTSTSGYDILLSISTLVNPAVKRTTNKLTTAFADRPNLRKLLQTNVKVEDSFAYEDLKEVLADYKEDDDDEDKENDRKKRNDDLLYDTQIKMVQEKHNPIGVHNPNWKGPMPLYPDELTQITLKTQDPENKVEIPVHNRDSAPETDGIEPIKTDVEYVEDYLDNGYERLVELAQAYSDYGVLNDKKNAAAEKKTTDKEYTLDNRKGGISMKRLKGSLKRGLKNQHFFERLKQSRGASEGIRIEIHSNPKKGDIHVPDESSIRFKEIFNKHIKILGDEPSSEPTQYSSVPDLSTSLAVTDIKLPNIGKAKSDKVFDPSNNVVFKKRTLKTADMISIDNSPYALDRHFDETSIKIKMDEDKIDANRNKIDSVTLMKFDNTSLHNKSIDLGNISRIKSEIKVKQAIQEKSADSEEVKQSSLSNMFMLLSKWFSMLDGMKIDEHNKSNVIPSTKSITVKKCSNKSRSESQLVYPVYDSDMIENIGHRSRVLLSVEPANDTEKAEGSSKAKDERSQIVKSSTSTESMNIANFTHEITESPKIDDTVSNQTNNRMVKRQAIDDSNLIFWNDLYDEEYGINADPMENNIRDKHSADKNNLNKKSSTWLQDKMKMITDRFYPGSPKKEKSEKETKVNPEKGERVVQANKSQKQKQIKRDLKYDSDDDDESGKLDLAVLTARMKEVCKETVKAVQETKHVDVREGNREDQAAASLMQQLVRLMTDLVDFQVQERTCRRLPPDLQSFLEWLTSSKEEDQDPDTYYREKNDNDRFGLDFANKLDKPTEQDLLQPSERENTDSKTDCLGTLHAVQNLIREYEEMTEDDKSVMTGVKNYLEHQIHFLQRHLSSIDDKYFDRGSRFRRDLIMNLGHTVADTIDDTAQSLGKQYKTLRKMYHKYKGKIVPAYKEAIKTTAEINKAVTEIVHKINKSKGKCHPTKVLNKHNKVTKINDKTKEELKKAQKNKKHKYRSNKMNSKDNANFKDKVNLAINKDNLFGIHSNQGFRNKDERNIKDVYFKAVEEAKKSSISKGIHIRDSDTFDKTDIFRINDYLGEKEN